MLLDKVVSTEPCVVDLKVVLRLLLEVIIVLAYEIEPCVGLWLDVHAVKHIIVVLWLDEPE